MAGESDTCFNEEIENRGGRAEENKNSEKIINHQRSAVISSCNCNTVRTIVESGPIRGAIKIVFDWELPKSLNEQRNERTTEKAICTVETTIKLESESETLYCNTVIYNKAKDHRIRIRLPLQHVNTCIADVYRSFVVSSEDVTRYTPAPGQGQMPMGDWVDISDETGGMAFSGKGLHEFNLETNDKQTVLNITLLRSVGAVLENGRWITPEAQMLGRIEYEYALLFHSGNWRKGNIAKRAARFINPSIIEVHGDAKAPWERYPTTTNYLHEIKDGREIWADTHHSTWRRVFASFDGWRRNEYIEASEIIKEYNFCPVELSSDELIISAFKMAERDRKGGTDHTQDLIIRIYSVAEEEKNYKLQFGFEMKEIWLSNMAEDCIQLLEIDETKAYSIHLVPFEIVTFRIKII